MNTARETMKARIKELLDDYHAMTEIRKPLVNEAVIRSAWHLHRAIDELEKVK